MNEQNKILLLGAVPATIPLIKKAKARGIHVVTCDYLPENEGHKYADESYYYSTTDIDAVIKLAEQLKIDGILSFNSDVSALTAAIVAEKMELPGTKPDVIRVMTQKQLFRQFLKDHHFNVPEFGCYENYENLRAELTKFSYPLVVKPTDLSGSKGVAKVSDEAELQFAFDNALALSRGKKVIVEEFIEPKGCQLHGDGFVHDGKLVFAYLGDHHYGLKMNNFVPFSTTWPSAHTEGEVQTALQEVQRCIAESGYMNGGVNIEVRITEEGKVYIMEIGPRNGGNFTPRVIEYATGFDFDEGAIDAALGIKKEYAYPSLSKDYYAYYVIHSGEEGIFQRIEYDKFLKNRTLEEWLYVKLDEQVESFKGGNTALGTLIVRLESREEVEQLLSEVHYKVCLR